MRCCLLILTAALTFQTPFSTLCLWCWGNSPFSSLSSRSTDGLMRCRPKCCSPQDSSKFFVGHHFICFQGWCFHFILSFLLEFLIFLKNKRHRNGFCWCYLFWPKLDWRFYLNKKWVTLKVRERKLYFNEVLIARIRQFFSECSDYKVHEDLSVEVVVNLLDYIVWVG